jgi:type IV pilus assembly protein PilE
MAFRFSPSSKGFTLVELLITMVVVAILAAIAFPAYVDHVMRARRSEARAALQEMAVRQQAFFLNSRTYTSTLGATGLNVAATTESGFYNLSVTNSASCPIASCFQLEATPTGPQAGDSCGTLVLTSVGTRLPAGCW